MSIEHPSFGKLDDSRVIVFDTTLRDGEQSPGFSMNLTEKLRMAEALTELGIDVMEAGFPIASPGDYESVFEIAKLIGNMDGGPVICGLARTGRADIMRAGEAVAPAKRRRIHTFIATSDLHMEHKLRMTRDEVLAATAGAVTVAREYTDDVEWSAEDGTRTDPDFLCRCVEAAIKAGATTINIPDTVGYALPEDMARIFTMVRERVPGAERVIFSTHNHNDLGLAVANTVAAIRAGVRQVECTINGIGERAGNAALEEIVMALRTRPDAVPARPAHIRHENILKTSRLLSTITGFDVQPNKAIVGRNAFAHEAGIHQDGMLKNAGTYEIMTPESVGWSKSSLVMGKHSGRAAFRDKLRTLGYGEIGDNQLNDAFRRFKDLADRKKVVYDEDISALVDDTTRDQDRIKFVSLDLRAGSKAPPKAELELEIDGTVTLATSSGDGPVDACFNAIGKLFPHTAKLTLYSVGAVTEGTDAQARVTVRLDENGKMVDGQGADTDTIVASVRAYVHALNKLLVKRERTEPAALSA
ncbi:MAG: 2-isopropylmalate synthase [Acetobacteraceae bacterium]|nr:2-isopropylmalate synthase [Acetobacteraceae bacterium]